MRACYFCNFSVTVKVASDMRLRAWIGLALMLCGLAGFAAAATADRPVVVIPIEGTVDQGMAHLVQRSVDEANDGIATGVDCG